MSVTLRPTVFPVGTSVGAYDAWRRNPDLPPSGTAFETEPVDDDGSLTFSTLPAARSWVAYAQVSGQHRYVGFGTPGSLGVVDVPDLAFDPATQAELDTAQALDVKVINEAANLKALGCVTDESVGSETVNTPIIQAAIDAGGLIWAPGGSYRHNALTWHDGAKIRGFGEGVTTFVPVPVTGTIYDFTRCSFGGFEDALIRPVLSAPRSNGEFFKLATGGDSCQKNEFRRLRIASPYKGWNLVDPSTTTIKDIEFLDAVGGGGWASAIHFSGAARSTILEKLRGGTAQAVADAFIYANGAGTDTVQGGEWDFATQGGASYKQFWIADGTRFELGRLSLEAATTESGLYVTGGLSVSIAVLHALGLRGVHVLGGKSLGIAGGQIVVCQREGVLLAGGGDTYLGAGLKISVVSQAAHNTYAAIQVLNGVNNFTIDHAKVIGNRLIPSATNLYKNPIVIDATNDNYWVEGPQVPGATGGVVDNGGGATKHVLTI